MFISDTKMAQLQYEDRLREAARDRFTQQTVTRNARNQQRLLAKLGDWLIVAGTTLKRAAQRERRSLPPFFREDLTRRSA